MDASGRLQRERGALLRCCEEGDEGRDGMEREKTNETCAFEGADGRKGEGFSLPDWNSSSEPQEEGRYFQE
jgi:hypothetical protein